MDNRFDVAFLGTNGSCAYNNGSRQEFGSNTLCVVVQAGGNTLLFDAGSGICGLSKLDSFKNDCYHLFLSHYHIDHVSGLLFWNSLFNPSSEISFYGMGDIKKTLNHLLSEPFQPAGFDDFKAKINFCDINNEDQILLINNTRVSRMFVSHPGGCAAYRVDYDGKSLCYLTDIELANHDNDENLIEFVKDTNLLIVDSCYKNGKSVKGWGHSTPDECAMLAKQSGARRLALFHHDYSATDADILQSESQAKIIFPNTFASRDGLYISIE